MHPEAEPPDRRRHPRRRPTARAAAALSLAAACLTPWFPADALAQREQRRIERAVRSADLSYIPQVDTSLSLTERAMFEVGGFASLTFINLDDSDSNNRTLWQPEVTLYGRAIIDGGHTVFARTRFQFREFSEGDSFDGRGDRWTEPFLERYWYDFDLRRLVAAYEGREQEWNVGVRVGRQFVDWGQGLTLSETLYAVRPRASFGRFGFEGLAGVTPTDESITDFDASRRGFDNDTERAFFGGLARYAWRDLDEVYAYVLHMADWNSGNAPRAPIGPVDFDYDATYLGLGARGTFTNTLLYEAEAVYQFGESRSDPLRGVQGAEDVSAWAARAQLSKVFRDERRSAVELEVLAASGDDDRLITTDTVGGNAPGTDDTAFNSLGFVNTGLAFAPSFSNLLQARLGASTYLLRGTGGWGELQVGVDGFWFMKLDEDAPIEEATTDDRQLGFEADLYANWRLTSDLTLVARYGLFFPGDAIAGDSDARQFLYLGATLSF